MDRVLGSLVGNKVLVYLDDVLKFAATIEGLLETLDQVFDFLINKNLKCKTSKYSLFAETIHYVGHVISNASIAPEQSKLDLIQQWPLPRTC